MNANMTTNMNTSSRVLCAMGYDYWQMLHLRELVELE